MSELKKIKSGIKYLSAGSIFSNIFIFLKAIILIRYFGVETYGLLSLALGIPIIFEMLILNTDYYLSYKVPKEIIKGKKSGNDRRKNLILTSYILKTGTIIFLSSLMYLFAKNISQIIGFQELESSIKIVAIVFLSKIFLGPLNIAIFNAFQDYQKSMIAGLLDKFGHFLTALIAVLIDASLDQYLLIHIFSVSLAGIYQNLILYRYSDHFLKGKMTFDNFFQDLKSMTIFSFPNSVRRQVVRYHGVFLRYLTAAVLDVFSVGIVAFIYNIFDLISVICTTGQKVFITSLAKVKDKDAFYIRVKKIIVNFNFIMIVIGLSIIFGAPYIVFIVGGDEFSDAASLIRDFVFAQYFLQILYVIGTYLVYYNLNYLYLFIEISKTTLIILTSYLVILSSQTIAYIPWVDAGFIFLEVAIISRIIMNSLGERISFKILRFFTSSFMILLFFLLVSSTLDQFRFYNEFLSLESIFIRMILFIMGVFFAYYIHKSIPGFVVSNNGLKIIVK